MDYLAASQRLVNSLHLSQPPVAICFSEAIPPGIPQNSNSVPAGCRFWQDATHSAFATNASHHALCAIGVHTHNLQPSTQQQTDLGNALQVFSDLGYVRAEDVAAIPVLQSRPKHVIYSPLAETPLPPDVVLLFVHAAQTLVLTEATQRIEGEHPPAMGRPACAVVPQVANHAVAALSLGCCGARAYLDVLDDDTAVFAIPGPKLERYVEQIETLSVANEVLSRFHKLRRTAVEAGESPTVEQSLQAMR